ncbi:serine-rich coiled-coil domain-containing protein 2-like isoform X2 [Nerophis ophidion]|uniref:serine-rich coiled-coil domain-containing protein 2-like isoform X2 n=1 Tax=Nerophis ophidion TaxID=159077 RepID=UPI002ADFF2CE|nr:serine-rich coiled-coil domain-containing protein 2-like isoform X2 [Nerophis ophidion]
MSRSAPDMPTMVSRLPKFAPWSKSGAAPASPTAPPTSSGQQGASSASVRRTRSIRTPTDYSTMWRKDRGVTEGGGIDKEGAGSRGVDVKHNLNRTAPNSPVDSKKSSCPVKESNKSQALPVSKSGLPVSKRKPSGSTPTKLHALPGSKLPSRLSSSVRPHRWSTGSSATTPAPGSGSRTGSSLPAALPATRSLSTGNLGSAPPSRLATNDRLRSRSLMAVQRRPSPSPSPSTNTTAKQPVTSCAPPSAQVSEGGGRCQALKATPSASKKPLLPGLSPAPKFNGISYKLSRPSLIKMPRPLRATPVHKSLTDPEVGRGSSVGTASSTGSSPESPPEGPESEGLPSQKEMSILGETMEEMSLSSSSSLDQNHTSQEYMDDFDDLGNGGLGVVLLAKNDEDDSGLDRTCTAFRDHGVAVNGVTEATELNFLDQTLDWTVRAGEGQNQLGPFSQLESQEQGCSSLDLSPSDSYGSGGIYMWDEEGLEPLGGAAMDCGVARRVSSFDSDANGSDVLTNLDSCDLDDDDLMLDGDSPEDASLRDGALTCEDGVSRMAEWRRRQLCWGTQEVHDDDDDSEPERYRPSQEDAGGDVVLGLHRPAVEELLGDFGAVRSQLEVLRRLLLQDQDQDQDQDHTLTTDTLSPQGAHQSQVLLQEVQQLKEELRNKDVIISHLTQQLAVAAATSRCRCQKACVRLERHTQTSMAAKECVASQTTWRVAPPVAFLSPPWQYQRSTPYRGRPRPSIPPHLARKNGGPASRQHQYVVALHAATLTTCLGVSVPGCNTVSVQQMSVWTRGRSSLLPRLTAFDEEAEKLLDLRRDRNFIFIHLNIKND